jgi:hypothetical protein
MSLANPAAARIAACPTRAITTALLQIDLGRRHAR